MSLSGHQNKCAAVQPHPWSWRDSGIWLKIPAVILDVAMEDGPTVSTASSSTTPWTPPRRMGQAPTVVATSAATVVATSTTPVNKGVQASPKRKARPMATAKPTKAATVVAPVPQIPDRRFRYGKLPSNYRPPSHDLFAALCLAPPSMRKTHRLAEKWTLPEYEATDLQIWGS